jgi:amino acid adenylation domain-containing protein
MINEESRDRRRLNTPPKESNSINNYQLTIHNLQLRVNSLAYVIYTSGTTGKPKGSLVEHRNVVSLMSHDNYLFEFDMKDVWTMFHSYCFDFSVWEIFGALLYGGKLVIISKMAAVDTQNFLEILKMQQVTVLNQTPSAFYRLMNLELKQPGKYLHIRYLIFGGEALNPQRLKGWYGKYPGVKFINMYGITETTVHVTFKEIGPIEMKTVNSNIGKGIPTLGVYILDKYLGMLPVGISGELCVDGEGLSRGYLNQPEPTKEKFVENPYKPGKMLYKSGDLARWTAVGELEYRGRIDHQVKIRGFRIEPGEIENRLLTDDRIKEAVVLAKKDNKNHKNLCAYIVAHRKILIPELKEFLLKFLPDYMVPSYIMQIPKIPLTPNGKVDRKALPGPRVDRHQQGTVPPQNQWEKKLVEIWAQVLDLKQDMIGIDDDFFNLGGHSLKATTAVAEIHQKLQVKIPLVQLFKTPKIRELAQYICRFMGNREHKYASIKPVEAKEYYPLSPTQKRMVILQQLVSGSTGYNVYFTIPLLEKIDKKKLESAFTGIIARHDSLRTSFQVVDDTPVQRIHKDVEFEIECDQSSVNCQGRGGVSSSIKVEKIIRDFVRPFDLACAPLLRVRLIERLHGAAESILVIDMHHIITDGTSNNILEKEFMDLYAGEDLPLLRLQYKDFSEWLRRKEQRQWIEQQKVYWMKVFSHESAVLNLPTDYTRPPMQDFEGNVVNFGLSPRETRILESTAKENNITLYMCLLAVFNILFSKLSGQEDIVLGTPIAARRHADLQRTIGMLVNTLAMRNYPAREKTFNEFLKEVKKQTLQAYENQEYPFEELVENIFVNRDTSRNPVFDILLNLMNQLELPAKAWQIRDKPPYEHVKATSRYDLGFSAMNVGDQVYFSLEYSTNLYIPATIERLIKYLKNIISSLPGNIDKRLGNIEILTEEEKKEILHLSCGIKESGEINQTIHQWFEKKAVEIPQNISLVFAEKHLTYGALNQRANRMARLLRTKGVKPDQVVGLMMERSIEMIAAVLAIMKAGSAYLPIDPDYPHQRVLFMIKDSQIQQLITTGSLLTRFPITSLKQMKSDKKNLVINVPRAQVKDFDRLPIPDRTLIDYEEYHRCIGEAPVKHSITLQATRGCPFNCLFCHKIWPKTHVIRSAENIFKEISYAYEAGLRRFVFIDDIFNLDRKNSSRLLEMIVKNKPDIQLFFPNGFRGDILDRDFIDLMVAAGTVNIDVALESASPRIQKLTRKNLNLEKFEENIRYIIENYPHVILEMEMIFGFPTESQEEAMMTLDFLKNLEWVHFPNLHMLKIYPNTDICKLAIESGISREAIERSSHLAYHQVPETLPFPGDFARRYQAKFMGEYFLVKERLIHVLRQQMKILTEDELVKKYDSYLSAEIRNFADLLRYTGISGEELGDVELMREEQYRVPDFSRKISKHFPVKAPLDNAFRILLLDLSLLFSQDQEHMLHHQVEEPLGMLYLMTFLNEKFGHLIAGKVLKSRIDFDSFDQLETILFDFKPHLIGIRTLTYYREFFHQTVLMIRQWGVNAAIVAGGPYATSDYPSILQDPDVDLAVLGEGEKTLGELVEIMMENNNQLPGEDILAKIPGIAFRKNKYYPPGKAGKLDIILMDECAAKLAQFPNQYLENLNRANDLVYVIYTSGSTGKPKGAMLEHRNLVNLFHFQFKYTNIDCTRILQFATLSFDASFHEIFSAFLSGGQLYLVDEETRANVEDLFDLIKKNEIKTLFLPMSFLKMIFNERDYMNMIPNCIRHIQTAGEQVMINRHFKHYLKTNHVYLHNHYGPSETHVVTAYTLDPSGDIPEFPSIGRPILNTGIYILDKAMNPVPVGVIGELYIGGIQVGRGYLKKEELTSRRFIENPFTKGEPMYYSGDLARWLPDDNVQFLGRVDQQVKIRGFRVELGEIEHQLANHPGIKETVVLAAEDETGDKYLCAYIIPSREKEYIISGLVEYLSQSLPDFMVPRCFIPLEKIPLTPSGKVDRRALPGPEIKTGSSCIAPRNQVEIKLVEIWGEVLGIEKDIVGIDSDFFQLGGHSLKATIFISKLHKLLNVKIPLAILFKTPTIRKLAQYIGGLKMNRFIGLEAVEKKEYYPLSSAQKRLYVLQQMELESTAYNVPQAYKLEGKLNGKALANTFRQLIKRHESLRTSIDIVNGEAIQQIHQKVEFKIEYYDISKVEAEVKVESYEGTGGLAPMSVESAAALSSNPQPAAALIGSFIRPFDLSHFPLLRVGLIKVENRKHILMVDMHHIITDGISMDLFVRESMALYAGEELPPLKFQYKDYSQWQNSPQQKRAVREQEKYWLRQFSDEAPVLNLPLDYSRPAVQSFEGDMLSSELSIETTRALKQLALDTGTTLYMLLLAIYNVLLSKLSGQQDIVVGTPGAARQHAELERIIGMFVNTLAMRNYPRGNKKFIDFLQELKEKTLEILENQEYQFEDLVQKVPVNRDQSRNPLFDTMFALQNMEAQAHGIPMVDIPQLKITPFETEYRTAKFDLNLTCFETEGKLLCSLEYCTKLFKSSTIERFLVYFQQILSAVLVKGNQKISQIEIITAEEKQQILHDFNHTAAAYPAGKTLHQLFAEQVERTPDNIAVVGEMQSPGRKTQTLERDKERHAPCAMPCALTYRELNEKSHQLAYYLIEKGIKPDTIVGIMMKRSLEMIIDIFGILKAGGAYMPIDPDYPEERINYMLEDSRVSILVSTPKLQVKVKAEVKERNGKSRKVTLKTINIEEDIFYFSKSAPSTLTCKVNSTNLAYVIYTSGSTGYPKGVLLQHRSVVNRLNWMQKNYPIDERDTLLQKTTYTFDVSVWEIFWWSMKGAKLCLLEPEGEKKPDTIIDNIETARVTAIHFVPSMLNVFLDYLKESGEANRLHSLKYVIASGEALTTLHVTRFYQVLAGAGFKPPKLSNLYGPTEAAVDVSSFDCPDDFSREVVPIGKPIDNIQLYIMDKYWYLQPVGIAGELCIAGDGLARGYLNRPQLTAQKFCLRRPGGTLFEKTAPPEPPRKNFLFEMPGKNYMKSYYRASMQLSYRQSPYYLPHSVIYLTGDLARWLSEGNIEFLGRKDYQVKVRGYRIETAEIEQNLLKINGIKEAIVIGKQDNDTIGSKYLCAFIAWDPALPEKDRTVLEIKEYLSQWLPDYMIPRQLVSLEKMPLTSVGKVDRKALENETLFTPGNKLEYAPPRDEKEKILARIWSNVLNIEKVGIYDNFFLLGGDSISSIIVISQAKKKGLHISTHQFFQHPTIHGVIKNIEKNKAARQQQNSSAADYLQPFALISREDQENLPPGIEDAYPLRMRQVDLLIQQDSPYGNFFLNFILSYKLKERFHREIFERAVQLLVERHPVFRTTYDLKNYSQYLQLIHKKISLPLVIEDLRKIPSPKQEEILKAVKENEKKQPVDWEKPGLISFIIHILDNETFHFTFRFHLSAVDGWSQMLIITELLTTYRSLLENPGFSPGLKLEASFKDALVRELESLNSDEIRKYWLGRLAGSGFKRIPGQSGTYSPAGCNHTGLHSVTFPPGLSGQLKKTAETLEIPVKIVLFTAHCVVIAALMESQDIVTGYEVNVRPEKIDGDKIPGIFTNIIPFRLIISKKKYTWSDLIKKVHQAETELIPYKHYPLAQLKEDLRKQELFESVFNFTHFRGYKTIDDSTGIEVTSTDLIPISDYTLRAEFGLNLLTGDIEFTIFYHTDVLSKDYINLTADCYLEVLRRLGENPSAGCEPPKMIDKKNAFK